MGDEGGWGTGAPSCWAVSLPTLSISAASPGGRSLSTPHHGGQWQPGWKGALAAGLCGLGSFLPPAKGTSLGLSPEPRMPLTLSPGTCPLQPSVPWVEIP